MVKGQVTGLGGNLKGKATFLHHARSMCYQHGMLLVRGTDCLVKVGFVRFLYSEFTFLPFHSLSFRSESVHGAHTQGGKGKYLHKLPETQVSSPSVNMYIYKLCYGLQCHITLFCCSN